MEEYRRARRRASDSGHGVGMTMSKLERTVHRVLGIFCGIWSVRIEPRRVLHTENKTLRRDTDVCIDGRSCCRAGRIDFDRHHGCA